MYTLHLIRTFVLWKVFPSCSSGYFSYLYTYLISAESSQAWLLATSWGDGFHWLNSLWAWSWEGRPGPATHSSCGNSRLLRLPVVKLKFKDYQKNNMGTACGCFASGYFLTTLFLKTRRRGNPGSHCGKVRELLSSASAPSAASLLVISEGVLRSQRTAGGAGELQPTPVLWSSPRRGTQHPGSPCWRDPLPLAPGRCVGPPGGGGSGRPPPPHLLPGAGGARSGAARGNLWGRKGAEPPLLLLLLVLLLLRPGAGGAGRGAAAAGPHAAAGTVLSAARPQQQQQPPPMTWTSSMSSGYSSLEEEESEEFFFTARTSFFRRPPGKSRAAPQVSAVRGAEGRPRPAGPLPPGRAATPPPPSLRSRPPRVRRPPPPREPPGPRDAAGRGRQGRGSLPGLGAAA